MRIPTLIIGLLALFTSSVSATALTYKLAANEKACFFSYVSQQNSKLAFYFAVSFLSVPTPCPPQSRFPIATDSYADTGVV
jgi:hypothetical protein